MGAKRLHIFVFLIFVLQGGLQCFNTLSSDEIVAKECMEGAIDRNVDTVLDKDGTRLCDHFRGYAFAGSENDDTKPKDAKPPVLRAENRCSLENNFPEKVAVKELQCYVSTSFGKIVLDTCPVNAIGCEVQIRTTFSDGSRIYSQLRGCSFEREVGSDEETCFETGCNSLEKYPVGSPSKFVSPATTASQTVPFVKTSTGKIVKIQWIAGFVLVQTWFSKRFVFLTLFFYSPAVLALEESFEYDYIIRDGEPWPDPGAANKPEQITNSPPEQEPMPDPGALNKPEQITNSPTEQEPMPDPGAANKPEHVTNSPPEQQPTPDHGGGEAATEPPTDDTKPTSGGQPKKGNGIPQNHPTPDQPKEGSGIPQNNSTPKMPAICHSLVVIVVLVTIVKMQTIFHFKQPV
uniref:Uncharacterized protein n=1 Tax=Panagrolaimus sp. JU765 TaxID=591449 RepID=A0AC34RPE2_9BILA